MDCCHIVCRRRVGGWPVRGGSLLYTQPASTREIVKSMFIQFNKNFVKLCSRKGLSYFLVLYLESSILTNVCSYWQVLFMHKILNKF